MKLQKHKLNDFLDGYGDGLHGTPTYSDDGTYFFINGNNLENNGIQITSDTLRISEDEYQKIKRPLTNNTILLSINGTLGKLAFYNGEKIALGKSACFLNIRNDVDKRYIKYVLSSKEFKKYMLTVASGSTIKNFAPKQAAEYEFFAPDLPTQKKIADVLSCIDNKIALNNKTNTELENMAKTIYDYWFTQFDFPDKNGHPYKSSGGQMVYNEILKREIPAGWEAGCFGDLIEIGNGKDHSKLDDGDIPVYGSGGLMRKVNKSLYSGESVLFPRKGTLNNVMYVNETFWTVDTMFYSIPKKQSLALYVYYNAKHFDFEKMNTGTGVPSMTSSIIKELPVIIPDTSILDSFDKTIQPIYQQVFSNRKENEELTKLRDYLLPLLMNGQIEVK